MKLCIILMCIVYSEAFAQGDSLDSLLNSDDQQGLVKDFTEKVDSIRAAFYQHSDSIRTSFKVKFTKMESAKTRLTLKLDSLNGCLPSIPNVLHENKIEFERSGFVGKLDSLSLSLQTSRVQHSLDSINNRIDSAMVNLDQKIRALKDKSIGKLNALELSPPLHQKVLEASAKIEGFKIPSTDLGLLSSDLNLPSLSNSGNISVHGLNGTNIPSAPPIKAGSLTDIGGTTGSLSSIAGNAGGYSSDVKALATGNLDEVKELPKTAETKLAGMSGLNEASQQTDALDSYKDIPAKMKNPDSLKVIAKQEVRQMAVNHFAGKEEQLQQAMETVSKLKLKYTSINSLKDVAKRPPNEMHGKPLIERIVPGIAMQVQKKGDDFMVDFNVYAGYRFTGRLTSGMEPAGGLQLS